MKRTFAMAAMFLSAFLFVFAFNTNSANAVEKTATVENTQIAQDDVDCIRVYGRAAVEFRCESSDSKEEAARKALDLATDRAKENCGAQGGTCKFEVVERNVEAVMVGDRCYVRAWVVAKCCCRP